MKAASLLGMLFVLASCSGLGPVPTFAPAAPRLAVLRDAALAWHTSPAVDQIQGLRLLEDAPRPARRTLAVLYSIARANPRLGPLDALMLASAAVERAQGAGLDPEFFCATILQESAFSPVALSSAAAVGIAQFTLDTAATYGVDPFDWDDALRGAALLLAGYTETYRDARQDPYVLALAAYNAGPGAVARYHGIPPYRETREYIDDIIDRWSRIVDRERGPRASREAAL